MSTRAIQIDPPTTDTAYRVKLVPARPGETVELTLLGQTERAEIAEGEYTAVIEDVATARRWSLDIGARTSRIAIPIPEPELSTALDDVRPSNLESLNRDIFKSAAPAASTGKAFCLGLSVDNRPGKRGGWTAPANPALSKTSADGGGESWAIEQPENWRDRPKWRLTVSVEGRAAIRMPLPLFSGGLILTMKLTTSNLGPDIGFSISPRDGRIASLIGAIQEDRSQERDAILDWASDITGVTAQDVLMTKSEDPWAAAVAALVLLRRPSPESRQWTLNLADRFPWLPDAHVAAARVTLQLDDLSPEEREARCLASLRSGRIAGAPYFTATNDVATELLNALAFGARDKSLGTAAKRERNIWAKRSLRGLRMGPFLSWEDDDPTLDRGSLDDRWYYPVAQGRFG